MKESQFIAKVLKQLIKNYSEETMMNYDANPDHTRIIQVIWNSQMVGPNQFDPNRQPAGASIEMRSNHIELVVWDGSNGVGGPKNMYDESGCTLKIEQDTSFAPLICFRNYYLVKRLFRLACSKHITMKNQVLNNTLNKMFPTMHDDKLLKP